jgi:2-hydroxy-3-keto-5-methylthiopentenyl-1-phosphate phosphatase
MTAWYARGEVGEYLRDLFDSVIDDAVSPEIAVSAMEAIGMNESEILEAIQDEIDILEAFDETVPEVTVH